jgi:hypothetical protein
MGWADWELLVAEPQKERSAKQQTEFSIDLGRGYTPRARARVNFYPRPSRPSLKSMTYRRGLLKKCRVFSIFLKAARPSRFF